MTHTTPSKTSAPQLDLTQASDSVLVNRASDGDKWAFSILARRYAPMMRAYALRFTGNLADSDDVVQESLTTAWQHIDQVHKPEAIRSWLMRLTGRKAIDLTRTRKTHADLEAVQDPPSTLGTPDTETLAKQGYEELADCLEILPQQQKQVWIMREIGGMSYADIAHDLGISATAVRGRLARARQTLMTQMEGWR